MILPFLRNLYLTSRLFHLMVLHVLLFLAAYFVPALLLPAQLLLLGTGLAVVLDGVLLFRGGAAVTGARTVPTRLSNGDENPITLSLTNAYPFEAHVEVIDELPAPLQVRDQQMALRLPAGQTRTLSYPVRPTSRGAYGFGHANAFVATPLGLVQRRYRLAQPQTVPVYPSFLQLNRYTLLAASDRLQEIGVKQIRRVGHTMEFDQIRPYVTGDDHRTVNWKATARSRHLMVNQYQDERAQHVYCLIDMGRVMQMPFAGLSLLDYAINASLVLSNVALRKQDKAGLITFADTVQTVVPATRKSGQMARLMDALYRLETAFKESSIARLHALVRRQVRQRSLLLLFTNFNTLAGMRRTLPYLRSLAARHLVVAVFFENTELHTLLAETPRDTEGVYLKTIAEKFAFEQREIVKELHRHGIQALLTPPENLTVGVINQYLEIKARRMI